MKKSIGEILGNENFVLHNREKIALLDVICAIDRNFNAHDDELEETWCDLKEKWEVAQQAMAELIKRGEK